MIDSSKIRGLLYVLQVIAGLAAVILAVGIVLFGWVTTEQVLAICTVAAGLYVAFTGLLAKLNLSPDVPKV